MYTVHESVGFWVVRNSDGNTVATCADEWKAKGVARAMNGYPVLLEACRALVEAHDEEPSVLTAREWEAARAAIRKATGGE